jgi:hypothetical protein
MASSVFTLAECLLEVRDVIAAAGGDDELVSPEQWAALLSRLQSIDPQTAAAGQFWDQEIGCF